MLQSSRCAHTIGLTGALASHTRHGSPRCSPARPWRGPAVRRPGPGLHRSARRPGQDLSVLPDAQSIGASRGMSGEGRRAELPPAGRQVGYEALGRAASIGVRGAAPAGRLGQSARASPSGGVASRGPAWLCRHRHRHRPGPPGPGAAIGLRPSAAARGERPGPAATPASASSPSEPRLLPPPGGRPAARAGRAAGTARLKGVAGGEVWRRSSGA